MELWELVAREVIRDLVARYTHAADTGRFDELAELFTEGGVLDVGEGRVLTGRAAIREFLGGQKTNLAATTASHLVRHHVANLRIDVSGPDAASGASYFFVVTDRGPDHWGRYRDAYAREGERWRFAHRRVRLDGYGPDSWAAARRRPPD